jgi:hypothetical protein
VTFASNALRFTLRLGATLAARAAARAVARASILAFILAFASVDAKAAHSQKRLIYVGAAGNAEFQRPVLARRPKESEARMSCNLGGWRARLQAF